MPLEAHDPTAHAEFEQWLEAYRICFNGIITPPMWRVLTGMPENHLQQAFFAGMLVGTIAEMHKDTPAIKAAVEECQRIAIEDSTEAGERIAAKLGELIEVQDDA